MNSNPNFLYKYGNRQAYDAKVYVLPKVQPFKPKLEIELRPSLRPVHDSCSPQLLRSDSVHLRKSQDWIRVRGPIQEDLKNR